MKLKNLFFVLLALALVLSLGVCAAAEGGDAPDVYVSGSCGAEGSNVTWTLSTDGVLTISGRGEMKNYRHMQPDMAPWYKSTGAHTDYPSVVKAVVEEGVTGIGDYAFHGLRQLSEVSLPSTVTHLGEHCFSYCESLETLELPAGLTKIEIRAFRQAEGLTHITIPEGVTVIEPQAFSNCEKLTSVTLPGTVTTIGYSAFASCLSLEQINLPSSITSIGRGAFFNCESLQQIELPNQLTEIPESAFDECYALTSVTIPESVTIIGEEAFQNCTALCSVNGYGIANLPDSITEIGAKAFRFCHSLEYVDLPENITEIKDWTFYATGLRQITIPANLRSIGESAFGSYADYDEQMLARVYINMTEETWRSEVTIGEYNDRLLRVKYIRYFFSGDGAAVVETRQIGPDVYYTLYENGHADIYGNGDTYASPDDSHSYFADSINWQIPVPVTSVEVKSGVTGLIDEYGLAGLRELQSVKLPASLVSIAPDMFYFCIGLESLELDPENPAYTVEDDVLFNKEKTRLIQYPLGKKDTTYAAPDGVEVIGAKAFCELQYLEELTLPDTVRTIERQAFEEAKSLRKVDLGNSVEFIDECAFFRADNIPVITIPGSVKHICNWAFGFRPDFTDVYYPCPKEAWDRIEICSENDPLLNATFHFGEHNWGDWTVVQNSTDTEPGLAQRVCQIDPSHTESFAIPAYGPATEVGDCGQNGDLVYYIVYEDGTLLITGTGAIRSEMFNSGSVAVSENVRNTNRLIMEDGVTAIGSNAFAFLHFNSISFGSTLVSIGSNAFYDNDGFETVVLPDSVKTVGDGAFALSSDLKAIVFGPNLETVGDWALLQCDNLETVVFWNKDTRIVELEHSAYFGTGLHTVNSGVIYSYGGGAVEAYANENGFPFVAIDRINWITLPFTTDGLSDGDWYLDLDAFVDAIGRGKTDEEKAEARAQIEQHVVFSCNPGGDQYVYKFEYTDLPGEDGTPDSGTVILPLGLTLGNADAFNDDYKALKNCVKQYHAPAPDEPEESKEKESWFDTHIVGPFKSAIATILSFFRRLFGKKR